MLLKNCTILKSGKEVVVDIILDNGRIVQIGNNLDFDSDVIDINENFVLPGVIDPHVHFREPGLTHKEDLYTGSCAAAAGGITSFLDMPNTIPTTTTVKLFEEKRKLAKKSIVNFGFHFGAAIDNLEEIKKVKNVASTKVFMNQSTGKMKIDDEKVLKDIFKASKVVAVHAEGEMVDKAIKLTKECGNRLYLCHISQRSELDVIKEEKTDKIFAEATPHHLFLSEQDHKDDFTRMIPGLKTVMDNEALMKAINSGLIDTIGTDHAPHTTGEKLGPEPPAGIPGCETVLALLLDAVNNNQLTLGDVQRLCCENPAKIFGMKRKGRIEPGYDADITVIDLDLVKTVSEDNLYTKCGWTPFEGRTLKGWPIMTIVNGFIVYDGEIHDEVKGKEVEFE